MPYIIIILLRHTLLKQADKLFLFDGKKRCTLTLAIPHQDIAHNGKSAYLHGGSSTDVISFSRISFPRENRPKNSNSLLLAVTV